MKRVLLYSVLLSIAIAGLVIALLASMATNVTSLFGGGLKAWLQVMLLLVTSLGQMVMVVLRLLLTRRAKARPREEL